MSQLEASASEPSTKKFMSSTWVYWPPQQQAYHSSTAVLPKTNQEAQENKVKKSQVWSVCWMHFPHILFKYWLVIQAVLDVTSSLRKVLPSQPLCLNSFFLSVQHLAIMFFCGCLNYEKEVHKQLDIAGIRENHSHHFAHTADCFELLCCRGVHVFSIVKYIFVSTVKCCTQVS